MIKCCDHQRDFSLYFEEAGKCARCGWSSVVNSLVEVRPRRVGGLACVRDLGVRGLVGVAAPRRDPVGSCIVEILRVSKAGM